MICLDEDYDVRHQRCIKALQAPPNNASSRDKLPVFFPLHHMLKRGQHGHIERARKEVERELLYKTTLPPPRDTGGQISSATLQKLIIQRAGYYANQCIVGATLND